ncbi:TetR/AcrR family transcriptional regulator [Planotetraspora kaengkrachanensis]|uniref:TetR family transcriptional regulator n=1 Tax=Planotetraspora kaengkrachanensis TaxID=575193 RepID=A0A8J3V9Z9_9ACTN|nr:TetR family transcriptional regulator [Planotetraspora kaengkrachanensis]GIG83650.1 TetR family transcriptional regulator [Planotetraspora kaengkrachanensis]
MTRGPAGGRAAVPEDRAPEKRRRPGRRPGAADTRGEILTAARKVFAEKGFDKATIRGIAREASVDPALVHHYFDTKDGIFVEAMQFPVDPATVIPTILAGPREEVGERLVRFILTLTADSQAREPVVALLRTAMANEQAVTMLREFLTQAVLGRVAEGLGIPPIRLQVAFSQMFGVIMMRYILKLEPLASADLEELVEILSPTIQRYLAG